MNILETLTYSQPQKEKVRFHASDWGKPVLDLYLKFKNVPETNPVTWNQVLRFGAGKGVELEALNILKQNGWVKEDYDQNVHGGFKMDREGIVVSGYMDAIHVDGSPIEIKSINTKNNIDIKKYQDGYPRENYVGQLAIYMDNLGVSKGYLFVISMDGLSTFWLECLKIDDGVYKCGNTIVDVNKQYRQWAKLYTEYVQKDIEPSVWQYRYKKDIEKIDWKTVSKTDISKARNGHKVIGDWEILYSPYKQLIIEKQGAGLGYSNDEMSKIKELTEGFTNW